jgi:sterol desaturase/sphingolipid hydroxylase (fatty acid hydroxylase superfamily)
MKLATLTTATFWDSVYNRVWDKLTGETGIALALIWLTVMLAAIVTYQRVTPEARSMRGFLRHVFPQGIFRNPSARADFLFWLSRHVTMPLMVLPLIFSTVTAGHAMYWVLTQIIGTPVHAPGPIGPVGLCFFTLTMLLAYDLSYYIYHYAQHKVPILWELHKVHHSAEVMIGVTKDRVHPLDELMNHWWDGVIPGLCYGIWLFFALDPVEITVFGINVYLLRNVILMMDFVRHTHLKLSYGRVLDGVFLSPHYHQLHHSVAEPHWDKNFGLALSVWDRLFGTLVKPMPDETFIFGLTDNEHKDYQTVLHLYVVPLKKMAGRLRLGALRHRPAPVSQSKA